MNLDDDAVDDRRPLCTRRSRVVGVAKVIVVLGVRGIMIFRETG